MTYAEFKSAIAAGLKGHRAGKTWKVLKADLKLPYDRPCPDWTRKLEQEIGLSREKVEGNALVWRVRK
jgi:hypothetical protein